MIAKKLAKMSLRIGQGSCADTQAYNIYGSVSLGTPPLLWYPPPPCGVGGGVVVEVLVVRIRVVIVVEVEVVVGVQVEVEVVVIVLVVPGARVRPSTNHWVFYQPTIGYLTNQLLGILPTNYWVSYQPTYNIPFINFPPPWQPMLLMIQVQVQHSLSIFPPLGNPWV